MEVKGIAGLNEAGRTTPPSPELKDRLIGANSLEDLGVDQRISYPLRTHGLRTPGDALLAGEENLKRVRNLGPKTLSELTAALAARIPEVPLPRNNDPALAAWMHESLGSVPAAVLDPTNAGLSHLQYTLGATVSIEKILSLPPPETLEYAGEATQTKQHRIDEMAKLRAMATRYAEEFREAQQALRHGDDQ